VLTTYEVDNYPGLPGIGGYDLGLKFREHADRLGALFKEDEVISVEDGPVKRVVCSGGIYEARAVILATGAIHRKLGIPGEEELGGAGVSYCATCDGEFFYGKEIFVIGGGFAAAEEGVFLTKFASHVTILIRDDDFSCAKAVAEAAKNHPKITVLTNTEVICVEGDHMLRRICYRNRNTGKETLFDSANDTFGVFVFAGYEPNTSLVKELVNLDPHG
jgi:thioredoxin reductase (NADPH)